MRQTGDHIPAERFDKMPYNPFTVPSGELFLTHYVELNKHRALYTPPVSEPDGPNYEALPIESIDIMAQVVAVVFDADSPLKDSEDLSYRMRSALLSLDVDDGFVHREVMSRGVFFRKMVYEYFRLTQNYQLEQWWSMKSLFHAFARQTQTPIQKLSGDEIKALITMTDAMEDLKKQIARLSFSLFKDTESARIVTAEKLEDTLAGEPEMRATSYDPDMGDYEFEDAEL